MTAPVRTERVLIRAEADIVSVRQLVRAWATEIGFGAVDQSKVTTAASEIARNTLIHGGGGVAVIEEVRDGPASGLRLTFSDSGRGIPDIDRAMTDGFTTGNGLGLGLGGTRRLMHEFQITSRQGEGTTVVIAHFKRR